MFMLSICEPEEHLTCRIGNRFEVTPLKLLNGLQICDGGAVLISSNSMLGLYITLKRERAFFEKTKTKQKHQRRAPSLGNADHSFISQTVTYLSGEWALNLEREGWVPAFARLPDTSFQWSCREVMPKDTYPHRFLVFERCTGEIFHFLPFSIFFAVALSLQGFERREISPTDILTNRLPQAQKMSRRRVLGIVSGPE